jgi:hypothetical protein
VCLDIRRLPVVYRDPEYVVSANRYNIFEDFGPDFSMVLTPLTFILFSAWPVAIGTVSLFYCGECLGLPSPGSYLTSHSHEHLLLLHV